MTTDLLSCLLPVLVLLPAAGGLLCFLFGTAGEHTGRKTLLKLRGLVSWLVPVLILAAVWLLLPGAGQTLTFSCPGLCALGMGFTLDWLRWILCLMGSTLWFGSAVFGQDYLAHASHKSRYYLYYLITEGATLGVFLSADLYTLLICFEVMGVASWTLVAHEETPGAMRAADSYLAFAILGGLVTLMGLFLLQHLFGTLVIADLAALAPACTNRPLLYTAGILTAFGFCAKCGMWPLHTWLPAAHPVAPATASALLSGIITKAGIFGLLVLSAKLFLHDALWGKGLLLLALITMATGAVLGVFSTNLKRTLACSSMSQIGFILTGLAMSELLGAENALAVHGLTLYMMNHSLFKLILFLAAGAVYMNLEELELNRIRGFGRGKPVLIVSFLAGLAGLAGIAGGSGYISKTLVHESIVEYIHHLEHTGLSAGAYHAAEWIFLVSGGLTLAYMLKLFICVCVEKNADPALQAKYDALNGRWCRKTSAGILAGFAALVPVLGCTPSFTMDRIAALADGFFGAESAEAVAYFSWSNLKGALISLAIGAAVYVLFVRKLLIRKGTYLDRWPAFLNIEDRIYRPLLLKVLPAAGYAAARLLSILEPGHFFGAVKYAGTLIARVLNVLEPGHFFGAVRFTGAFIARSLGTLPELLRKGFCALLYARNGNGYVRPGENDRFTVYEQDPKGFRGFPASLAFSLLLFCSMLVLILIFLLLR